VLRALGKVNNGNAALRALHGELIGQLQARGSFEVTSAATDILEIPKDPLLPWQSPFTTQQVSIPRHSWNAWRLPSGFCGRRQSRVP
jgi:hypothetical protein